MTPVLGATPVEGPPVATPAELRARLGAVAGELRALQGAVLAGTMTVAVAAAHQRLLAVEGRTIALALATFPSPPRLADELLRALEP
ncbi:hypothetical protein ACSRUE_01490 [Sorangium sp. KYC3313]|uniref:hypothetical protein n=1 Tax=Sorangium sp. KYC3313 TaxID=3449740 RepID=UPI003F8B9369